MPDEKRIERYTHFWSPLTYECKKDDDGLWVKYTDHLDALGEVEKTNRDIARREMDEREALEAKVAEQRAYIDLLVKAGKGSEDAFEAAETKLETLRSGLKAEVERLDDLCRMHISLGGMDAAEELAQTSDRLQALLDALSEDTEKQSGGGAS